MTTLSRLNAGQEGIPTSTAWLLADLSEFKGKQELYTVQSPQRLKALRQHAIIESAVASNRIEGVTMDAERVRDVLVAAKPLFRDRDEEEIRGYRDALARIHESSGNLPISMETILQLHAITRGNIWDAGKIKEQDSNILERYPDGQERVRFRTVPAAQTFESLSRLIGDWNACLKEEKVHPLIASAAFNLDFLCIHPFRDGNGRVSRLMFLLQCHQFQYEAGRYISLEGLIEQNKDRYYETLEHSSQGWHENTHDPWPYVNFILSILRTAYKEFTERAGSIKERRGEKTERIIRALSGMPPAFTLTQIEQQCPGVSRELIRRVLREQKGKSLKCSGRGPGAIWHKITGKE